MLSSPACRVDGALTTNRAAQALHNHCDVAVPESFGGLLRRHRLAAGLTQEELAERAGLSPRGVAYLEAEGRVPRPATVRRLAAALGLDAGDAAAVQAAADLLGDGSSVEASHRLEVPLTAILGRDGATAEAASLLRRPGVRLLTLTGAAGVGKTRLAHHVADRHGLELADEVVAVALDGVRDPELVISAVAGVLGVRQERSRPLLQAVAEHLQGRAVLLLLDGFEQVLDAASTVVELLRAAPRLEILVTSRAPLRVPGEQELQVPPLELPDPDRSGDAEAARRSPAVALFLDRAVRIRPGLVVDDDTARAVAQICRRLDGLPLAIELAAARLRVLTPDQIIGRLDDGLRVLGRPEVAPGRQRTLRATLDWSYELLSDAERALFRRLSVCAGGWGIEAAEALCTSGEAVDLLSRLVEQSLVVADPHGSSMRYRCLHPIRLYARERLEAAGEADGAARAHAEHLLALAEEAEGMLAGARQREWLDRLEQDHANLREALSWLRARGGAWEDLRMAVALWRFWWLRGYATEGRDTLRGLLRQAGAAPPAPERTRALQSLGELAWRQGDWAEARETLESALRVARMWGDRRAIAEAERSLSRLAIEEGSHAEARALLDSCLRTERELDARRGLPVTLSHLGWLALAEERPDQAEEHLREALALSREIGDQVGVAVQLLSLAEVALERGDIDAAGADAAAALRIFDELRFGAAIPHALEALADVAHARGDDAQALRLAGAASALREAGVCAAIRELRARSERTVQTARTALGVRAEGIWAEARALSLRAALDEALGDVSATTRSSW